MKTSHLAYVDISCNISCVRSDMLMGISHIYFNKQLHKMELYHIEKREKLNFDELIS